MFGLSDQLVTGGHHLVHSPRKWELRLEVRIWHGWLKAWLQTSGQKKAKRPEISHLALWKIKHIQAGLGICHFIYKPRIVYQNLCRRCLIDSQRSNLQNHILSASISDSEWRKTCFWPSVLLFLASNRGTFQRDHRKGHDRHGHQKLHWRDTDETPHSCGKCCRFCLWGGRSMNLWPTKKLRHLAQNWFATKMVFFSDQRF